jgi:hypothetical protein
VDAKLAEKLEKLRALAEHPATPRNEALAALAIMTRIMAEHGLSEADLASADPVRETAEPMTEREEAEASAWHLPLATAVAGACDVFAFHRTPHKTLVFVGRRSAVDGALYLYRLARASIDRLARQHAMGQGRAYAASYRLGCVAGFRDAAHAERERWRDQLRRSAEPNAIAILSRDPKSEAKRWYSETYGVKFHSAPRRRSTSESGFGAGREAGAGIYDPNARGIGGGALRLGSGK